MSSLLVTTSLSVSISDGGTGSTALTKAVTFTYTASVYAYQTSFRVPTSSTPLTLPTPVVNFGYLKNIGNTDVTVTWTPNGGSSAVVQTLKPGGGIDFQQVSQGRGITALSVQAITAATFIEYILAG